MRLKVTIMATAEPPSPTFTPRIDVTSNAVARDSRPRQRAYKRAVVRKQPDLFMVTVKYATEDRRDRPRGADEAARARRSRPRSRCRDSERYFTQTDELYRRI